MTRLSTCQGTNISHMDTVQVLTGIMDVNKLTSNDEISSNLNQWVIHRPSNPQNLLPVSQCMPISHSGCCWQLFKTSHSHQRHLTGVKNSRGMIEIKTYSVAPNVTTPVSLRCNLKTPSRLLARILGPCNCPGVERIWRKKNPKVPFTGNINTNY